MSDDQLDLRFEPTSVDIACFLITLGVGCVAYMHVPYYGATPLAMGVTILVIHVVWRLWHWAVRW